MMTMMMVVMMMMMVMMELLVEEQFVDAEQRPGALWANISSISSSMLYHPGTGGCRFYK